MWYLALLKNNTTFSKDIIQKSFEKGAKRGGV